MAGIHAEHRSLRQPQHPHQQPHSSQDTHHTPLQAPPPSTRNAGGLFPQQQQQSCSVPSTPYQRPRDYRFRSTSPSPSRTVKNLSPHSVASETVVNGSNVAHRNAPVVCKFETGDEIRKRRIPYVDGGNEELNPPATEPLTALTPHDEDKLSGDMRELYDRLLLPSPESEARRAQLVQKLETILHNEWPGNDIRVNVFGSSGNLLSSTDSDVDICITTPLKKLESMHSLASLLHRHGMEKIICRAAAKVPIVKCWDPELQLAMDLNVNNPLALQNTRMIKTYVQLDPRVRPLAKIVKYWTKQRILNDAAFGGTISSYTWICMIISFLQRRDPPILPSLQKMEDKRTEVTDDGTPASPFADDVDAIKGFGDANTESLGGLLFNFFRHYGYEFEFSKYVVSVKEGRLLSRQEKGWEPSNYLDKEARNRLCVEEPFTTNRNLGNSADDYAWHGIHGEIRRAFHLLADGGQLEKCCEQYEFPLEEKPIFQRPVPKPKPTLTRSASQSGRSNHEGGSNRSRKSNHRNQSAQRAAGNRRASSGASFSNTRIAYSPHMGANPADYFAAKGNLHEQLYQQYQFLQAQQDALRSQLAQQQTQAAHVQPRVGDLHGSPRPRGYVNGLPSPRFVENPPQTAPLLPGYLYHYPARYPPQSPMSQARSREGSNTNPSSPSLLAAAPALRRQAQRASQADSATATGSARSQSQPGRSLPHPLTLQQHVHPGYDVSGALNTLQPLQTPRGSQIYGPGQPGMPLTFSPFASTYPMAHALDTAMPKEYVGYYVGQSPQLGPQYAIPGQMLPPPPLALRDPPTRQRRVTPDLAPPATNNRHDSRSPSPLDNSRSISTTAELRSVPSHTSLASSSYEQPGSSSLHVPPEIDLGGPLIVNGSNRNAYARASERTYGNGTAASISSPASFLHADHHAPPAIHEDDFGRTRKNTLRTERDRKVLNSEQTAYDNTQRQSTSPPDMSPKSRAMSTPINHSLTVSPHPMIAPSAVEVPEHFHDHLPVVAPLLSPVAELRTPSPTQSRTFEQPSPQTNGASNLHRVTSVADVPPPPTPKAPSANQNSTHYDMPAPAPKQNSSGSLLRSSSPLPQGVSPLPPRAMSLASSIPSNSPLVVSSRPDIPLPSAPPVNPNPWQQAVRKGHRKSKSLASASLQHSANSKPLAGQPLPANESERKGG